MHEQRVRQQRTGHHRGDPEPLSTVGAPTRASSRVAPASDQVIRKTPLASAVKNSPSAAIEKPTATSTPRITPLRSQRPGSRSLNTHHSTTGATQPADQLRCPLACEMKPGAKPQNRAAAAAATRRPVTYRQKKKYQATAAPARFRVRIVTKLICGPSSQLSGANNTMNTVIEVFAARLTPTGAFSSVVKNGSAPWLVTYTP